ALVALAFFCSTTIHAQMQATLNASNFNGYNISCYGMQDGTLTVNISNGTAPYSYTWSNGDTLATVSSLSAGYYAVRVRDAAGGDTTLQITLTQPEQLAIAEMTPYYYANDYNVSTYGACNGSVTTLINGGVLPLTYHWEPGQQNTLAPSNLCGRENTLTVTDLNGCKASSSINLKEPQRDDWTMTGNWGSNAVTNFIGTNDNADLVFKTNGTERMRLMGNGDIKINAFTGTDNRILTTDATGKIIPGPVVITPSQPCADPYTFAWQIKTAISANIAYTCWNKVGIGTDDPQKNLGVKGGTRFFNFNDHTKYLDVEHDGANASINATDNVLINYYSGKNIYLNTGSFKGDVETGGNTYLATGSGNVGIGINSALDKLDVNGRLRVRGSDFRLGVDDGRATNNTEGLALVHDDNDVLAVGFGNSFEGGVRVDASLGLGVNPVLPSWNGSITPPPGKKMLAITGDNPMIKLFDNYTDPQFPADETSEIALIASSGYGRLVSDKGFAVFLDADNNSSTNADFRIYKNASHWSGSEIEIFRVNNDGYVGCRGVKVTQSSFPDYVFKNDYGLMDIKDLSLYIKKHKRLPGMPSALEVTKDGMDIGEITNKLVEKIEELTLYIIELKKENETIKQKLEKF
ncbi:MAG TPA: SprB repeat-containing protein, partial [Bacteroidia bacterium]|nr:SprB repeat-containing protein [Bacteroidia bacterium]HMU18521.1 SprB repeat-containing protein [Bacteroidia bacterium]